MIFSCHDWDHCHGEAPGLLPLSPVSGTCHALRRGLPLRLSQAVMQRLQKPLLPLLLSA